MIGALYKVSDIVKIDDRIAWSDPDMWWDHIRAIKTNEIILCIDDSRVTKLKVLLESGEVAWMKSYGLTLVG